MFPAKIALLIVDKFALQQLALQHLCTLQIVRLQWKITVSPHCVFIFFVSHSFSFLNGGKLIARGVEQTVVIGLLLH